MPRVRMPDVPMVALRKAQTHYATNSRAVTEDVTSSAGGALRSSDRSHYDVRHDLAHAPFPR